MPDFQPRLVSAKLLLALLISCSTLPADPRSGVPDDWWVGAAKLEPDGTIVVQIGFSENGLIADSLLRYPVGDPHYAEVKSHVGHLEVGEWKHIPPWPSN